MKIIIILITVMISLSLQKAKNSIDIDIDEEIGIMMIPIPQGKHYTKNNKINGGFTTGKITEQKEVKTKNRTIDTLNSLIVQIDRFKIGETEITQKQWKTIMGKNPSKFKNCDNCPVENISWSDAQTFINKLNKKTGKKYRLPMQHEWEFAAIGGQDYLYSGSDEVEEVGWVQTNSNGKTHPVKQKKKNGYGLYDMSGNVSEWCQCWLNIVEDNYRCIEDSNGSLQLIKGGSWLPMIFYSEIYSFHLTPTNVRTNDIGFRLVLPY